MKQRTDQKAKALSKWEQYIYHTCCCCYYNHPGNVASFMYVPIFLQRTRIGCIIKNKKILITPAIKPAVSLEALFASNFLLSVPSFLPSHE